jgi:hypothetical protein
MKSVLKVSHCIEIPCDRRYYWLSCIAWTYVTSYLIPNYRPNFVISSLFYTLVTACFALRNTFYFFNYAVKYSQHQYVKFTNIALPTQPTLVQPSIGNREVSKYITRIIRIKCSFYFYKIRKLLYSANNSAVFSNTHQLDTLHNHFHFIETQSLDILRLSLAHPQEALREHSFGGCSVL